jgi:hypothetical protein
VGRVARGTRRALARRGAAPPWRLAAVTLAALALAAADAVLPTPLRLAAGALGPGERALTALLVAASAWVGVRMTVGVHDASARRRRLSGRGRGRQAAHYSAAGHASILRG